MYAAPGESGRGRGSNSPIEQTPCILYHLDERNFIILPFGLSYAAKLMGGGCVNCGSAEQKMSALTVRVTTTFLVGYSFITFCLSKIITPHLSHKRHQLWQKVQWRSGAKPICGCPVCFERHRNGVYKERHQAAFSLPELSKQSGYWARWQYAIALQSYN